MIPFLKALLWDQAAARGTLLAIATAAGIFYAQPNGRSIEERLLTAAAASLGVGVASAGSPRSAAAADEIAELRARLDAISGPKIGP